MIELQEPSGANHRLAYADAPGMAGLLARYEAPNGSIDRFEYDSQRRLSRNLDGDGSGWTLSPPVGDGSVTATTAMGRQKSIQDVPRQNWWLGSDRVETGFDGHEQRSHRSYWGTLERQWADGFRVTETPIPDQRFGMASPTQTLERQWSPGNTVRQTTYRHSTPVPGSGAWGERISNWSEWTYQNQEPSWQLEYNVSTSRLIRSSPAGRKMQALLDAWQRPTEVELPGQYRQQFLYDPRGRLLSLQTQDLADPAASAHRTQTQSYHPSGTPGAGQLASRTDALGRTTRWEYDAAHRLSRQIGPDGRRIDYRYDLAGRLRELNTPNGAGHRFDYTLSDRLSQYQAPELSGLDDASTHWVYNADRLLTRIQRPGAQVLQLQRDSAGRLQDLLDGPYSTHFEWGPEGRLQLAKTEAGHRIEQHYDNALLRSSLTQLGPWSLKQHYRYEGEGSASFLPRVQSLQLSLGDGPEETIEFQHDLDGLLTGFGPLALKRDPATGWLSGLSLGRIQSSQSYNGLGEVLQSRSSYAYSPAQLDARLRPLLKTGFQALGQALSDELTRQNSCSIPWPEPDDEGDSQLSRASAESQSAWSGVTPPPQPHAISAAPSRRSPAMGRVTEVLAQSIGAGRLSPEQQTVADTESAALSFIPDPGQRLQSLDSGCGLGNSGKANENLDTVFEQLAQGQFSLEPLSMADPYHPAPERCTVTARFEAADPSQTYYPVIADWQAYFGPEATPTNARLSPVLQWQALGQRARVGILDAQNLPIDRTTDLSSSCDGQLEGLNFTTAPLQGPCAVNFYSQGLYDDPPRKRYTLRVDDLTPGSLTRLQLLSVPEGQPAVISLPTPPARQVISHCGNGSVKLLDIRPQADAPGAPADLSGWEFFELDAPTGDCQVQAWALPPEQNYTVSVQAGQGGHASPATQTVWAGRSATLEIWSDPGMKIDQLQSSCPLQVQGWGRYSTAPLQSDCQIDVSFRASQAWRPRDFCQADLEAFNRRWAELLESPLSAASRSSLKALLELTQTRYAQGAAGFIPTHYPDGSPIDPGLRPTQSYLSAAVQQQILALRQLLDTPTGQADLYQLELHRNSVGQITWTEQSLDGAAPRIRRYTYTEAGQLQSAGHETPDGQTVNTVTWGYDANGNRLTENGQTIAQYDEQDRLLRWKGNTYRYTPAGDLQERQSPEGRSRYHYDAQGNLRRVETECGSHIHYAIDPLNRRIGKQRDGQWQWWLLWLDKLRPLARLDAQGQLESIYYYGEHANVPEGLRKNGQDYRILTDQIGSVRLVVNSETGEEMQRIDYDEWGQITLDTNPGFQPFGFAGGLYDPDTGLTRFGVRDYDPQTGRWTAKDPILFEGGEVALYGYVHGNPISYIDPFGLDATNWWNTAGGRSPITDGPTNGNWGGGKWSGGLGGGATGDKPALDSGDECYRRHDECYDAGFGKSYCDRKLVDELNELSGDSRMWPKPPKNGTEGDSDRFRRGAILIFDK